MGAMDIHGEGNVTLTDQERNAVNSSSLKMYGDFQQDSSIPSTFEEAIAFYKTLPEMAGTIEDHYPGAARLGAVMMPIQLLCDETDTILNRITEGIITRVSTVLDELDTSRKNVEALLEQEPSVRFPPLNKNLRKFSIPLEDATLEFKKQLGDLLPNIRGGSGDGESALIDLIKQYTDSVFEISSCNLFLGNRERENAAIVTVLQNYEETSNIQVADYKSGNDINFIYSRDHVLVMELNVLSLENVTESFLNGDTVDESSNWYNNPNVVGEVGHDLRKYSRFAWENADDEKLGYLLRINKVQSNPLKLEYIHANITETFQIPNAPSSAEISRVSYDSINVIVKKPLPSIIGVGFQLNETLEGQGIKRVLNFKPDETEKEFVISGLDAFTSYTFQFVYYITKVGNSEKLQMNLDLDTAPSSPPHSVITKEVKVDSINLAWAPPNFIGDRLNSSILSYNITLLNEENDIEFAETTAAGETELSIDHLTPATAYRYSIRAFIGMAESEEATGIVYTSSIPPTIHVLPAEVGTTSATIHWSPPDRIPTGATILLYYIRYFLSGEEGSDPGTSTIYEIPVETNQTEYSVNDPTPGLTYIFQVKVSTTKGDSPYSNGFKLTTDYNETDLEQLQRVLSEKVENLADELQEEMEGVQGDINVMQDKLQGEIEGVQGDLVDIQNANSALCAYQDLEGNGNNGLSGEIVVYDTTYLETNGASCSLDESTGKFTAGKSGVYQISVSARSGDTEDNQYFNVNLRTSSGNYQDGYQAYIAQQHASGTSYLHTPLNAIRFISLQQGETAWLEYGCSSSDKTDCYIVALKFCVSLYK